jgi:hypothetical protein
MTRLLNKHEEITVKTHVEGTPVSIVRKGRSEQVKGIYQRWRVADEWWRQEIARDYFRIRTSSGLVCDIYRDMASNRWYLSRIHD